MATSSAPILAVDGGRPAVDRDELRRWPEITKADVAAVVSALETDIGSAAGKNVTLLGEEFCAYTSRKYAVVVSSGTAACHAALIAAGVRSGDEVIVPALSFQATFLAVQQCDARPIIADIRPDTFTMDWGDAARLVSERTRAIFPVHAHGLVADMDAAQKFATRHGVVLVEDACQAMGATAHGRMAGDFGVTAAFSLARAKPWTAVVGGIMSTDDTDSYQAARYLANLGERRQPLAPGDLRAYWCEYPGFNYRLSASDAALARSQLKRLDAYLARARENLAALCDGLDGIPGLVVPHIPSDHVPSVAYARFMVDPAVFGWTGHPRECSDRIIWALRAEGVMASRWQLNPLSAMPALRRSTAEPYYPGMPQAPLRPVDRTLHPVTWHVLDSSFILGEEPYMFHVQTDRAMTQFVEGIRKVFEPAHMARILASDDYKPVRIVPPIPEDIM